LNESIRFAQSDKEKIDALRLLSQEHATLRDWKIVKDISSQILEIDNSLKTSDVRLTYSILSYEMGDYPTAELYSNKLLGLSKYYAEAQQIQCKCAMKMFNKPLAIIRLKSFSNNSKIISLNYIGFIIHSFISLNELEESKRLLDSIDNKYNNQAWFKLLRAMQALEDKNFLRVVELLEGLSIEELPDWIESKEYFMGILARAYEKLGNFNKAHQYYYLQSKYSSNKFKKLKLNDHIKSYQTLELSDLTKPNYDEKAFVPTFMIGFPRSGTTLLETVLDTHPDIVTMSEPPTISNVIKYLNKNYKKKYPYCLVELDKNDIEILQSIYFETVDKLVIDRDSFDCLIDKMPLNTIHIPLISMLFPTAKFIVNIRHPLDVIYSNFQQNYAINNEMGFLITLKGIANRYKQVFSFYDRLVKNLNLNIFYMKYEDLVLDIDTEYSKLLEYLSLPESSNYKNFPEYAKTKVINTSSKNQVSQSLYTSSLFKWKNYEVQLNEIEPIVSGYIKKFGYK